MPERREVFYSGRVQGVGFRFTAREIATQFPVAGYVENLPDGRVHLVAEGSSPVIDAFLEGISRQMGRKIEHCVVDRQTASGEFTDFHIRH